MPDKRKHRGPHPEDEHLFAPSQWPALQRAVHDLSWLLSCGYAQKSSLKLVGDRFALKERQRIALMRCACSDDALAKRSAKQIEKDLLDGETLLLDGYNVLTTIEAALAGGVIIKGGDGCFRDIASVHGTYRKVQETVPGIDLIGGFLASCAVSRCLWYLDRPVSNSGRLKKILLETASKQKWNWQVELVYDPDAVLSASDNIIASSDSEILNRCQRWFNLCRELVSSSLPQAWVVDLSTAPPCPEKNSSSKNAPLS